MTENDFASPQEYGYYLMKQSQPQPYKGNQADCLREQIIKKEAQNGKAQSHRK